MDKAVLGVIGGSGMYEIDEMEDIKCRRVTTPFGNPSGDYISGVIRDTPVVFLPRHGPGHTLLPSEINYRANIHGFRQLGVRHLLSISAVGSLSERIRPGDMVLPEQFIDRTRGRENTFFGDGAAVHVQFGDPVCPVMVQAMSAVLDGLAVHYHRGGTYVAMEGPVFSTRAESELYRSWGADVIGMTCIPEAKLAREAEICYATLALSTDYDCWHALEEEVSVGAVLGVIHSNISIARKSIVGLAERFPPAGSCKCRQALDGAMLTVPDRIPDATKKRIELLAGRFFNAC